MQHGHQYGNHTRPSFMESSERVSSTTNDENGNSQSVWDNGNICNMEPSGSNLNTSAQYAQTTGPQDFQNIAHQSQSFQNIDNQSQSFQNIDNQSESYQNINNHSQSYQSINNQLQSYQNINNQSQSFRIVNNQAQVIPNPSTQSQFMQNFNAQSQFIQSPSIYYQSQFKPSSSFQPQCMQSPSIQANYIQKQNADPRSQVMQNIDNQTEFYRSPSAQSQYIQNLKPFFQPQFMQQHNSNPQMQLVTQVPHQRPILPQTQPQLPIPMVNSIKVENNQHSIPVPIPMVGNQKKQIYRNFQCLLCSKLYASKKSTKNHVIKFHGEDPDTAAEKIGKIGAAHAQQIKVEPGQSSLQVQELPVITDTERDQYPNPIPIVGKKPLDRNFYCLLCPKVYASKKSTKHHLVKFHGENPATAADKIGFKRQELELVDVKIKT